MSSEWLDLLFGNPIGLASMITVISTFIIVVVLLVMFIVKSGKNADSQD